MKVLWCYGVVHRSDTVSERRLVRLFTSQVYVSEWLLEMELTMVNTAVTNLAAYFVTSDFTYGLSRLSKDEVLPVLH